MLFIGTGGYLLKLGALYWNWGLFIGTGGFLLELGAFYWNLGAISGMTGAKVAPPSALWAGARKT